MDTQSLLSTEGSGKTCGHFWRNSYSKGFPSQPSGAPLPATAAQKPTPADLELRTAQKPSFNRRKRRRRGRTRGTAGGRPGFSWPGEGPGSVQKERWGNPPLPILSQFSGFPKGLPGAYKSLWGKSPLRLPLVSCQGPALQPQYFSRLHSDTHKWRRSKPDQKKCGCG